MLDLISTQNKPFSVQLAADFLAQFGIKKSQAQKALEHLAEEQKIRFKVKWTVPVTMNTWPYLSSWPQLFSTVTNGS